MKANAIVRFFKAEEQNDAYRQVFELENGVSIVYSPLMSIQFKDTKEAKAVLLNGEYDGIVVSSRQAVIFINNILRELDENQFGTVSQRLANTLLFSVGNRSIQEAEFSVKSIVDAPNAQLLAQSIKDSYGPSSANRTKLRLVYFCSEQRGDKINALNATGEASVDELVVYKPIYTPFVIPTDECKDDTWWVFFSSLSVDVVFAAFETIPSHIRIACIGEPSSAHLLASKNITTDAVAPLPNATSLYAAMYAPR